MNEIVGRNINCDVIIDVLLSKKNIYVTNNASLCLCAPPSQVMESIDDFSVIYLYAVIFNVFK